MTDEEREAQETQRQSERRQALLLLARRSASTVEFLDLVEMFDLEEELEEQLLKKESWATAVTKARAALKLQQL